MEPDAQRPSSYQGQVRHAAHRVTASIGGERRRVARLAGDRNDQRPGAFNHIGGNNHDELHRGSAQNLCQARTDDHLVIPRQAIETATRDRQLHSRRAETRTDASDPGCRPCGSLRDHEERSDVYDGAMVEAGAILNFTE